MLCYKIPLVESIVYSLHGKEADCLLSFVFPLDCKAMYFNSIGLSHFSFPIPLFLAAEAAGCFPISIPLFFY